MITNSSTESLNTGELPQEMMVAKLSEQLAAKDEELKKACELIPLRWTAGREQILVTEAIEICRRIPNGAVYRPVAMLLKKKYPSEFGSLTADKVSVKLRQMLSLHEIYQLVMEYGGEHLEDGTLKFDTKIEVLLPAQRAKNPNAPLSFSTVCVYYQRLKSRGYTSSSYMAELADLMSPRIRYRRWSKEQYSSARSSNLGLKAKKANADALQKHKVAFGIVKPHLEPFSKEQRTRIKNRLRASEVLDLVLGPQTNEELQWLLHSLVEKQVPGPSPVKTKFSKEEQ